MRTLALAFAIVAACSPEIQEVPPEPPAPPPEMMQPPAYRLEIRTDIGDPAEPGDDQLVMWDTKLNTACSKNPLGSTRVQPQPEFCIPEGWFERKPVSASIWGFPDSDSASFWLDAECVQRRVFGIRKEYRGTPIRWGFEYDETRLFRSAVHAVTRIPDTSNVLYRHDGTTGACAKMDVQPIYDLMQVLELYGSDGIVPAEEFATAREMREVAERNRLPK